MTTTAPTKLKVAFQTAVATFSVEFEDTLKNPKNSLVELQIFFSDADRGFLLGVMETVNLTCGTSWNLENISRINSEPVTGRTCLKVIGIERS